MSTAVQATATMFKEAAAMAASIQKAGMANGYALVELGGRFNEACTHRETTSLTLYMKALPKLVDNIEGCLDSMIPFQRLMTEIEEDESYVHAHLAALGKLTMMVDTSRSQATSQFQACKQMKATGLRLLAEMTQTVERAERLLASHDKWVNDQRKAILAAVGKAATLLAAAEQAAAKRDAKALATARKAFAAVDLAGLIDFPAEIEHKVAATLQQMSVVAADKGQGSAIAAEIRATLSTRQELAPVLAKLAAAKARMDALAIGGVDVKKAARALDLDATAEPKLTKALAAASIEKGLDTLAKELKLKTTGKAMLATLQRARLA
jgi:hypothetical protein